MPLPASREQLAAFIDHTLLKPEATAPAIDRLCAEARSHGFGAVCINPVWIERARRALADSGVQVCTVIGFPLGANATATKRFEAERAIADGADELDMVVSLGPLLAGEHAFVQDDIAAVVAAAEGRVVKVILETALLSPEQIREASRLAVAAGAAFVKTSTGFGPGGATVAAVQTMREVVGPTIGVKASGGIRDAATAKAMIEAGANRLGTSASIAILDGWAG